MNEPDPPNDPDGVIARAKARIRELHKETDHHQRILERHRLIKTLAGLRATANLIDREWFTAYPEQRDAMLRQSHLYLTELHLSVGEPPLPSVETS